MSSSKVKNNWSHAKTVLSLTRNGEWDAKNTTNSGFSKFFNVSEELSQQIDCYRVVRPSLLKTLVGSGNLNVFLLLIEYYSIKSKESEFLVLVDAILNFLMTLSRDD